ncbi:MAG: hypothetical protein HY532_02925 [Chloroflexi bacterium]|nr:hypothetical protein [Chloroflexota bacterium]
MATLLLLSVGCRATPALALPVTLAAETQEVVQEIQGIEQVVFVTLQTNLGKVKALSQALRETPQDPRHREEIILVLQEVTESFQDLSNQRVDFREELQAKLKRLEELEVRANEAIQKLEVRHTELGQQRESPDSDDPYVIAARQEAFGQAQRYVEQQVSIWNQFVVTHDAIQSELGTINQRIEAFLSMIDATTVVYHEALNLVRLQQDVRWALSLFSEDLPQMAVLTEDMRSSWGTIDSLVEALLTLTEPATSEPA